MPSIAPAPALSASPASRPARVLLIDGGSELESLLAARLARLGHGLVRVNTAREGLNQARRQRPDLILLDHTLPDMDGVTLCRTLQAEPHLAEIPIIFLTGDSRPQTTVQAFAAGATDYIARPFHGAVLLARVQTALRLRGMVRLLESQARTCPLTGLVNRKGFIEALDQRLGAGPDPFAILYLDLDRFKQVNDALGHKIGDALLCRVADLLREAVQSHRSPGASGHHDRIARMGGDEFTILLGQAPDRTRALQLADRIQALLSRTQQIDGQDVQIGVSIGVRLCQPPAGDSASLMRDSDIAMYRAKSSGRGKSVFFDQTMLTEASRIARIDQELPHALKREQLSLLYQPILDLDTGTVIAAEAHLRWHHPTLGLIPATEFLPRAIETRRIQSIGDWVLQRGLSDLARWRRDAPEAAPLRLSLNMTRAQLLRRGLIPRLVHALATAGLPPEALQLEMTEAHLLPLSPALRRILIELRALGIRLAMAGFGSGLSSLAALQELPLSELKIDATLTRCVEGQRGYGAIVHALITLAQNLGFTTVAEGVATANQVAALQALGCQSAQGPWFSGPMAHHPMQRFLSRCSAPRRAG